MRKSRFSEEQIVAIIKEYEGGAKVTELTRRHAISAALLEISNNVTAGIRSGKEIVLAPECHRADCVLGGIVGNFQTTVIDVAGESCPADTGIADGTGQSTFAGDLGEDFVEPLGKVIEQWLCFFLACPAALNGRFAAQSFFDFEQRADPVECFFCHR